MKSVANWLPLPIWLIALMFIVGAGAGFGLALILSEHGMETTTAIAPWEEEAAKVATTPAPDPQPPKPAENTAGDSDTNPNAKTDAKAEKPAEAAKPPKKVGPPPPNDERWLKNMINSPVKRALKGAGQRMQEKLAQCFDELGRPASDIPARISYEALGGMATMLEVELYVGNPGTLQSCLVRRTSQMLIDFPVEDGNYEMLTVLKGK